MTSQAGSQPPFGGALPKPPPIKLVPVVSAALARPPQHLLPRPQVSPVGNPVILHPPAAQGSTPAVVHPKQTTLYVGKIAQGVGDNLMKQLLEACGRVKSWKRMEDPDTKALKLFGFCEYEEADGVVRALNLLQNLSVGGQELLLKCNTGTQKYIDEFENRKAREAASGGLSEEENTADADNQALEKIMGLVSSHVQALPPPPEATAAADSFLSSLKAESDRNRERMLSKDGRGRSARRDIGDDSKDAAAKFEREKERERKDAAVRVHEQDVMYKAAFRKWEAVESDKQRRAERERDHEKDAVKERQRQLRADLEVSAAEAVEPWKQKLYIGSRRATDRKRRREKESQEDDADRLREEQELEQQAKRQKQEEEAARQAAEESGNGVESPAAASPAPSSPKFEDPNDSITQAMLQAAKAPHPSQDVPPQSPPQLPVPPRREVAVVLPSKTRLAAFGGGEEEEQPKRFLKPIAYSAEEEKAALKKAPKDPKAKAAAVREVIAQVPTESKAVFSYAVNWKAYDEGGEPLKDKIKAWVSKKTAELLGEEEVSMVDFIMAQVHEHAAAQQLLDELQGVLDDEANSFVFKLFRMIIFETLKQEAGLQDV